MFDKKDLIFFETFVLPFFKNVFHSIIKYSLVRIADTKFIMVGSVFSNTTGGPHLRTYDSNGEIFDTVFQNHIGYVSVPYTFLLLFII